MVEPPRWSEAELARDVKASIDIFRTSRLEEPVEAYLLHYDKYWDNIGDLLELTVDLTDTSDAVMARVLADDQMVHAFRYLPGPPISSDDLDTLVDCGQVNASELKRNPGLASKVAETVMSCHDRRRFPWVSEKREPTESEREAAKVASAALMAYQRTQTDRRTEGKEIQEKKVHDLLIANGFKEILRKKISVNDDFPARSEFSGEAILGKSKADFVVGNLDGRVLAIECKVSNSSINSVKRLNREAAGKALSWTQDFGKQSVVPIAVLSGVYKLQNLVEAQDRGITLFWAHSLTALTAWIAKCKPPAKRAT
jgi:hypothetical protein